jgi:hypothetical protein
MWAAEPPGPAATRLPNLRRPGPGPAANGIGIPLL